jgi:hypothetical protein
MHAAAPEPLTPPCVPKLDLAAVPVAQKAERRQSVAKRRIGEALMFGADASQLEAVLEEGLAAGVPDALLEQGVMRLSELRERQTEESPATPGAQAKPLQRRHTVGSLPTKPQAHPLREGVLVKVGGLSSGIHIFSQRQIALDRYQPAAPLHASSPPLPSPSTSRLLPLTTHPVAPHIPHSRPAPPPRMTATAGTTVGWDAWWSSRLPG